MFVKKKGEGNRFIEDSIELSSMPYPNYHSVNVDFSIRLQSVLKHSHDRNTNNSKCKQSKRIKTVRRGRQTGVSFKGSSVSTVFVTWSSYSLMMTIDASRDIFYKRHAEQRSALSSANKTAANLC